MDRSGRKYARTGHMCRRLRHPLPKVGDRSWPKGAIDRFILARLDREGLFPSPPAVGTPYYAGFLGLRACPFAEDVDRFASDSFPTPTNGPWTRLWPGLLRRALGGHVARPGTLRRFLRLHPRPAPHDLAVADSLIRRAQRRLPYDRFTIELLAGDLLPAATPEQSSQRGSIAIPPPIPKGRHRRGIPIRGRRRSRQHHDAGLDGHDFGCAQCHNHKYDPFTQGKLSGLRDLQQHGRVNSEDPPSRPLAWAASAEFEDSRSGWPGERGSRPRNVRSITEKPRGRSRSMTGPSSATDIAEVLARARRQTKPDRRQPDLATHHRSPRRDGRSDAPKAAAARGMELLSTTPLVMKEDRRRPTHIAIRGRVPKPGQSGQARHSPAALTRLRRHQPRPPRAGPLGRRFPTIRSPLAWR